MSQIEDKKIGKLSSDIQSINQADVIGEDLKSDSEYVKGANLDQSKVAFNNRLRLSTLETSSYIDHRPARGGGLMRASSQLDDNPRLSTLVPGSSTKLPV